MIQTDDLATLVDKLSKREPDDRFSLIDLPCDRGYLLRTIRHSVEDLVMRLFPDDVYADFRKDFLIALGEAMTNAFKHCLCDPEVDPKSVSYVVYGLYGSKLVAVVYNRGEHFCEPQAAGGDENMDEDGRGWLIIRKFVADYPAYVEFPEPIIPSQEVGDVVVTFIVSNPNR